MEKSGSVSRDEIVVLQLLEEIQRLVELGGGGTKPGEDVNPRMHPAAKLYLDTRDTFEVVETLVEKAVYGKPKLLRKLSQKLSTSDATEVSFPRLHCEISASPALNNAVVDRIEELFRHLGNLLGPSILKELRLRKLSITSILHYVSFLPIKCQWIAYKEARKEEVELVYRDAVATEAFDAARQTDVQSLRQHANFVKQQIQKDVDTVWLHAGDGTLTTIFGDDRATVDENAAIKFESLIEDVYSTYLRKTLDAQIEQLMVVSEQWAHDTTSTHCKLVADTGQVQCYNRPRKFYSKGGIFPDMLMNLVKCSGNLPTAQPVKLLVADPRHVGVWWQKSVHSVSRTDVATLHYDKSRDIFGKVETLDNQLYVPLLGKIGEYDGSRLFGRSGNRVKWVNQRVLVNSGEDSLWVEVVIVDADEKRCKLQVKESLQNCHEVASWAQLLALNEWVNVRELRFIGVPVNPLFRVHMGLKFREILEAVNTVVKDISSVCPSEELNDKVGHALWKSVEPSISRGEHVFARYFRSILQHEDLVQAHQAVPVTRSTSVIQSSSYINVSFVQGNSSQSLARDMGSARAMQLSLQSARASSVQSITRVETGHFDEHGTYFSRRQSRLRGSIEPRSARSEATTDTRVLSPFEKLAHHLLEETEIVGTCVQAQNVALSCAFVQVLLEKIAKMNENIETVLQLPSCTVEYVVSEYANACRLLFVWRICRHQVDTMAREGRESNRHNDDTDSRFIHLNWIDHAFKRVETQILGMMKSLVHYAHRAFFHECMNYLLPGIYEQSWTANKPWFGNTRCTYAVQGFVFRMQLLLEYVNNTVLVDYGRNLGVHDQLYQLMVQMLLDVLACFAEAYESLIVSRSREGQWKIDVLYLVCGIYKLLKQLNRMPTSRQGTTGKHKATNEIRFICIRLLVRVAVRSSPVHVVLDTLKKMQANSFNQHVDTITLSELKYHVVSIFDSVGLKVKDFEDFGSDEGEKKLWTIHSIFGNMEMKKLLGVQLDCRMLISTSSLSKQVLMGFLLQRHELGDWTFPVLGEAELQARDQLQQFIDSVANDTKQNEQEGPDTIFSKQPPVTSTHTSENSSSPLVSSDDVSEEAPINLPT